MNVQLDWLRAAFLVIPLSGQAAKAAPSGPTIFASDAMKPGLNAVSAAWTANGGKSVTLFYASSAVLVRQLAAGAHADVVIAGDAASMDELVKQDLIKAHTRQNTFGDDLVLIGPADAAAPFKIVTGFDLAGKLGDGKLAICSAASCMAGIAGKQALETLKVWPSVQPKLAQTADAAAVLLQVSRGEARLGILCASEAKAEPKVKVVDVFPSSTHEPIVYPIALLKSSTDPDAARFEAYMRSGQATRILVGQGYKVVR